MIVMRLYLVGALALFLSAVCRGEENVVDLIIVSGQSNAVGFDTQATQLPEDPRDEDVMLWWRGGDYPPNSNDSSFNQQWVPLQTQPKGNPRSGDPGNFSFAEGGFGPEMGLVRTLLDAQPDRPLAVIKVAYNSTEIQWWLPANSNIYPILAQELNLAIAAAAAEGITLRPRAFVWCQGERDANQGTSTTNYRNFLETLVGALRSDLDAPEMIALFGINSKFGLSNWATATQPSSAVSNIIAAQQQAADNSPLAEWVDDWGCEVVNQAHFGSAGTLELGRRYAAALLELEAALAPHLVLEHMNGDTTVTEGGDPDTYTVVLNRAPGEEVVVSLAVDDQVTVTPTSLTFTPGNWEVPQVVTVTAVDDDVREMLHTGTITHTTGSSDPAWDGLSQDFVVIVIDNDNTAPVANAGLDQTLALSESELWTPANIPTAAWFDASDADTITENGGVVSQWDDKSGNHVTLTGTAGPTGGASLNGVNALSFAEAQHLSYHGNNINYGPGAPAIQAVFVAKAVTPKDVALLFHYYTATDSAQVFGITTGDNSDNRRLTARHYNGYVRSDYTYSPEEIKIVSYSITANGTYGSDAKFFINGASTGTFANNGGRRLNFGSNTPTLTLGSASEVVFGEFLMIPGVLSAGDRQKLEGYLAHKWDLVTSLPADHPHKDVAPGKIFARTTLNGTATDADGDPLTTTWTKVSGPGEVTFADASAVRTTAAFSEPGTYVLRLTADDTLATGIDEVTITVLDLVPESFDEWISGFDLDGQTGFNDVNTDDGVTNGMKYFFGIEPTEPGSGLSALALDVSDGNQFNFTHPIAEYFTRGIRAEYRWSKDLVAFHDDGATVEGTTVTFVRGERDEEGRVTVTATLDGTATDRIFVALFVTKIE
ncbi:MAG: hypothetical protein JJU05_02850 [Verrucomicrobia bacterium]|nr:hypothetical protein [Verrucomicrobiota bacterium]MCH8527683.1 hypothetical protein [Kiritimatiellia bacterium]